MALLSKYQDALNYIANVSTFYNLDSRIFFYSYFSQWNKNYKNKEQMALLIFLFIYIYFKIFCHFLQIGYPKPFLVISP